MKRMLAILMLLFLLTGCAGQTAAPSGTAFNNALYMSSNADRSIAAAEKGFYYIDANHLYYADFETMEPVPVCARPNCLHDRETDQERMRLCQSYIQGLAPSLFYADGYLYTTVEEPGEKFNGEKAVIRSLVRISAVGSERKTIYRFDRQPSGPQFGGGNMMALHRGYCYWIGAQWNEKLEEQAGLWRVALDGAHEAEYLGPLEWQGQALAAYHLCIIDDKPVFLADSEDGSVRTSPFMYDPKSRTLTRLFDIGEEGGYGGYCYPWNGGLFCALTVNEAGEAVTAGYTARRDGSHAERVFEEFTGPYITDDRYLYILIPEALAPRYPDTPLFRVFDRDGEVLALDLAVPGCDYLCLLDRYVLIHYTNWTGAGTETGICWFDKDDIAKGGLQIRELTCD